MAYDAVAAMAISEDLFISNFIDAWTIATTNGFTDLTKINENFSMGSNSAVDEIMDRTLGIENSNDPNGCTNGSTDTAIVQTEFEKLVYNFFNPNN